MTFYDLLRLLVEKGSFTETQQTDMYATIANMEHGNAFGSVAIQEIRAHGCVWDGSKTNPRCLYCRGTM